MQFASEEILETVGMIADDKLDIRTVTPGISLWDCSDPDTRACAGKIREKVLRRADRLTVVAEELARTCGIPNVNTRISLTPLALVVLAADPGAFVEVGVAVD